MNNILDTLFAFTLWGAALYFFPLTTLFVFVCLVVYDRDSSSDYHHNGIAIRQALPICPQELNKEQSE